MELKKLNRVMIVSVGYPGTRIPSTALHVVTDSADYHKNQVNFDPILYCTFPLSCKKYLFGMQIIIYNVQVVADSESSV